MIKHVQVITCLCLLLLTACSQQRFSFRKTIPVDKEELLVKSTENVVVERGLLNKLPILGETNNHNIHVTQPVVAANKTSTTKKLVRLTQISKVIPKIPLYKSSSLDETPIKKEIDSYAVMSLLVGIASLFVFGLLLGIAAIVTGLVAVFNIKKGKTKGIWLALLGIFIGFLSVLVILNYFVLNLGFFVFFLIAVAILVLLSLLDFVG